MLILYQLIKYNLMINNEQLHDILFRITKVKSKKYWFDFSRRATMNERSAHDGGGGDGGVFPPCLSHTCS